MLENSYPSWISSASFPEEQLHYLQTNGFLQSNQFEDYEINKNLESILSSKRVACVGPSQHLREEETGELIDSYLQKDKKSTSSSIGLVLTKGVGDMFVKQNSYDEIFKIVEEYFNMPK